MKWNLGNIPLIPKKVLKKRGKDEHRYMGQIKSKWQDNVLIPSNIKYKWSKHNKGRDRHIGLKNKT